MELDGVAALPDSSSGWAEVRGTMSLLVETAGLLSCRGETTHLTMLLVGVANPANVGIVANDLVHGVDEDDLIVLVQ